MLVGRLVDIPWIINMLLFFVRSFLFGGLNSSDNLKPLLYHHYPNIFARALATHRYAPTLIALFIREYGRGRRKGKRSDQTQRYSAGVCCILEKSAEATGELTKLRIVSS